MAVGRRVSQGAGGGGLRRLLRGRATGPRRTGERVPDRPPRRPRSPDSVRGQQRCADRRGIPHPRPVAGHLSRHPAEPVPSRRRHPVGAPAVAPHLFFSARTWITPRFGAGPWGSTFGVGDGSRYSSKIATARVHRRGGVNLHREAGHLEPVGGQRLQVVQLLDVGVADGAAGAMAFPDDRRVVVLGVAPRGEGERRVQLQASVPVSRTPRSSRYRWRLDPSRSPSRRSPARLAGPALVLTSTTPAARACPDAVQLLFDVGHGRHVAVREVPESSSRRLQTPFQRHLVDGDGAPAAVHRRGVVVGASR